MQLSNLTFFSRLDFKYNLFDCLTKSFALDKLPFSSCPLQERIEKIINVSLVYEEKMFDYINDLLRQTNSTNKDLFKNTTAFKQHSHALYRAREEVSQNQYINLCGEYLQQNPEFKDYVVKVINNSMDNIKNSELKNLCEKEQFMALIEKEILNFSLKTQQQNIKSKNRL